MLKMPFFGKIDFCVFEKKGHCMFEGAWRVILMRPKDVYENNIALWFEL